MSNKRFYVIATIFLVVVLGGTYAIFGGDEDAAENQPQQSAPTDNGLRINN